MTDCYTFNLSLTTLVRREKMNEARYRHGLQKMTQKIFAFGGSRLAPEVGSAEVYDVVQNSWKNLPDMPEVGDEVTCARVQNQIFLTGARFRLISYDIHTEAYSCVG